MENQNLPPDEQDIDAFSTPVQNFAFGGIANPVQRAMLRGSDKEYLGARQKELDAFEAQRLSYNDALTKYQNEVYNPYKAQTDAYNAAAQKYNDEIYNPYKTKYEAYEKAISDWNAGDRTTDYAGPEAPTLASTFDMTAPKDPDAFTMKAPEVPFKVEDVQAYQQQAAERARDDAGNRSVAIDVVSDPDRFNFGSMSVSNRFMAKGGEVKSKEKSAKEMLGEMDGGYEPDDAAILKMAQEISSKGKLTHAQIMEAVDRVAAAGRGGDELLAYLSPASVEILKKMGGSGSINPATGLHEFKGGVIGKIVGAIKRVFNPRSAAPAAVAAVAEPAAAPASTALSAADLQKQLDDANKAREALTSQNALQLSTLKEQQAAALKKQQEEATAAQQLAVQNALKADADARAKAALPMSNAITGSNAMTGGLTAGTALDLMYRSTMGGVPTSELQKYGGYEAVAKAAGAAGFNATPKWIDSYEKSMKMPESEYTKRNKLFFSPGGAGYNNPDAGSWDGVTPGGGYVPLPKSQISVNPFSGLTASKTNAYTIPSNLSTIGSAGTIGQIDLGGPLDVGWSRYLDKTRDEERQGKMPTGSVFGQNGERTDITASQVPVTQPTLYQNQGVGQVGQVGDIGGINITGPAAPMVFGSSPMRGGNAATNPNNYFGISQPGQQGISPGTMAIGSPDMPMYGAMNTMNAIGQNKNLSPTMLGGAQNAGIMTDRLGNRIYAPGMGPLFGPPGFAKGGLADVNEFNMADAEDEPINTDPAGSAQKMLADLTGPTKSVTEITESPNAKSIKRVSKKTSGGAGGTAKGMSMEYEALTSAKDLVPQLKDDGSARSQMEALALAYKLRAQQATDKSRGLMRNTLGAPTLEQPTLTKGSLTKKRFAEGGEAKKTSAQEVEEPSILRVTSYSTDAAERMFPGQMGQDDQRDAARHMLAAATVAKKFGPGAAEFLGKAHERMSNPESFFSMFGIGKPRDDYEMDVHNNKLGAELAARTKSQAELEKLVASMAAQSQNKQTAGKPWTMSKEQMANRKGQVTTQPPEYQKGGMVKALKGTKAVDDSGKPVMAYRGEYGASPGVSTELGSLSFGTKDAANLYATSPNNAAKSVEASKVFPSYLSIRKPLMNDPQDPFIELGTLRKALGKKEFDRVVKSNVDFIQGTNAFEELADAKGYKSVLEVMKKDPKAFDQLYTNIYPILDDAKTVKALQKRGYDGAIYGGSGATALEPEYRVFSASQAISPYGNKPMAPRSAGQQFGDLLRSMEVSPTDALNFLGKAGGVAASALTPSTLNEGEDAELARRRAMPPTVTRAEGSPVEGEESLDKYYAPKARPSTGLNRKEGPISKQLKSGEAYVNMAKGVTELPYDIAGAPVDLATMLMRPFGYSTEKPVMGSDWIKQQLTDAKIRPEPPADSTSKGFYTAGELLSNLTNPAAVSRKVGPVVEKGVKAGAKEVGRQLDRAIMDEAGPLAKFVPQSAKPLYAVRPTGSTMMSGPIGLQEDVSKLDQVLKSGMTNAKSAAGQNEGQEMIMRDFWDKKARNYFTRQFGTPDDPIATAISKKQIKGTALDEMFPEYLIDQIGVGKTRVNAEGQERFFPKYPRAMEDFTSRYDKATGIKGGLITLDPEAANPKYSNLLSDEGRLQGLVAEQREQDKLLAQGVRPELINTDVGTVARSAMDKSKVIGDGPDSAKALLNAYEESKQFGKMDDTQKTSWINQIFGEGRRILGKNEAEVGKNLLPENIKTAIDKGEPVYDVDFMRAPLTELFNPTSINKYLASIPPREAANIRFEDAVKGALKMKEKAAELENVVSRIKSGKPVADTVFSKGVSAPLLQIDKGPLEGYAWKRIEKREATVPEGAYVGHSVGGYETGGATYTQEKREGFNTGRWQVYTLRDNRNRPVNTIEVQMLDELTPVVMQVKGNGRATGNTAPEKYDSAVLQFFQDYLRPAAIKEKDEFLTPSLQEYKNGINASFKMP